MESFWYLDEIPINQVRNIYTRRDLNVQEKIPLDLLVDNLTVFWEKNQPSFLVKYQIHIIRISKNKEVFILKINSIKKMENKINSSEIYDFHIKRTNDIFTKISEYSNKFYERCCLRLKLKNDKNDNVFYKISNNTQYKSSVFRSNSFI